MSHPTAESSESKAIIDEVEVASDTLTGRGGLSLFVRYLRGIGLYGQLEGFFGSMRRSRKGQAVCFFLDGTSRHLAYFDSLKEDEGYALAIETEPGEMLSSHAVKRFLMGFWWPRIYLFRHLLPRLFLWRLRIEKPKVVMLGLDTMVMDNKGFQPLQMRWGRFVMEAVFRRGDAHSNHSDTVQNMVRHIVGKIRKHYSSDVPIVIRLDSGFFDQKLFDIFEELEVGYACGGKLYEDIKAHVSKVDRGSWGRYEQGRQVWEFVEMEDRRGSWKRSRRAIFCRPLCEDGQLVLGFARPDTLIYTNLGRGEPIDQRLIACGRSDLLTAGGIIGLYHGRGSDELVHRALKDFGFEGLPVKRFAQDAAFYYTMLTAFFLYESFKEDVCGQLVEIGSYATTVRRHGLPGHRPTLKAVSQPVTAEVFPKSATRSLPTSMAPVGAQNRAA